MINNSSSSLDFNILITNFCKEQQFKNYVRQAINDELFWKDFVNNVNANTKIQNFLSTAKTEIDNKVDNKILKFKQSIPKEVDNEVNKILISTLSKVLPSYLNDHVVMSKILKDHQDSLNNALLTAGNDLLLKLANEPQYQLMTQNVLTNMESRYQEAIKNQIKKHDDTIKLTLDNVKKDAKESLEKFDKFNSDQQKLKEKMDKLECEVIKNRNNSTLTSCVGAICFSATLCFGMYMLFSPTNIRLTF